MVGMLVAAALRVEVLRVVLMVEITVVLRAVLRVVLVELTRLVLALLVLLMLLVLLVPLGGAPPNADLSIFASIVTPLVLPPVEKSPTSMPVSWGKICADKVTSPTPPKTSTEEESRRMRMVTLPSLPGASGA
jgi:hypothetical protein